MNGHVQSLDGQAATKLLRGDETAEMLAISVRTLRRIAARGELRRVIVGRGCLRYRLDDVTELIEQRTTPRVQSAVEGKSP
jgi:excisionase family DNA binding protein